MSYILAYKSTPSVSRIEKYASIFVLNGRLKKFLEASKKPWTEKIKKSVRMDKNVRPTCRSTKKKYCQKMSQKMSKISRLVRDYIAFLEQESTIKSKLLKYFS